MRHKTAFAALVLATAVAGAASAAPTVNVAIGEQLQKKADKYGQRELTYLSSDLQRTIQSMVARRGGDGLENAQFNLVIADAKPNRPTFEQMGDTPGLSMQSIGLGGATVEGSVTYPDGRVVPVKYSYYNHSIVEAIGSTTWTGAGRAFDMFAHRIARGESVQRN